MKFDSCPIVCPRRIEPLWRLDKSTRQGIVSDSGYLAVPYQKEALLVKEAGELPYVVVREWDGSEFYWDRKCSYKGEYLDFSFILYGYYSESDEGSAFQVFDVLRWGEEDRLGLIYKKRFLMIQDGVADAIRQYDGVEISSVRKVEDCQGSFENVSNPHAEDRIYPWDCGIRLISKYHSFTFCGANSQFVMPYPVTLKCFITYNYRDGGHSSVGAFDRVTGEIVNLGDVACKDLAEGQVIKVRCYDYSPRSKKFWKLEVLTTEVMEAPDNCVVQVSPYLSWYFENSLPK